MMEIDEAVLGFVIGNGGAKVKGIERKTESKVRISKQPRADDSSKRLVHISGEEDSMRSTAAQIHHATELGEERTQTEHTRDTKSDWPAQMQDPLPVEEGAASSSTQAQTLISELLSTVLVQVGSSFQAARFLLPCKPR